VAGCQAFRVDHIDDRSLDSENRIEEDTTLLADPSIPKGAEKRKIFFSKKTNLERFHFETDLLYTFDFYANFFSPSRHRLEITPFFMIDLIPYFNGYP